MEIELTPADPDEQAIRATSEVGDTIELEGLAAGSWRLSAWVDRDLDGEWEGAWGDPEPTALMGISLPRDELQVALRSGVQEPVLDGEPELVALHDEAWELARDHVAAGTAENGFADHYMDEAFSDQVFQWDTCFMAIFGLHGLDAFPVMGSLDNFYGTQDAGGYICRVVNESDGQPGGDASDPSEPMLNPPLFAWAEHAYARRTGDLSRIPRVLEVLDAYHDWIDANVRTEPGLYYTSMLGSGMDNAPRDSAYDGWVDITAQQALGRRSLGALAALVGDDALAAEQEAEAERICADVRDRMWDETEGFFFDIDAGGALLTEKTLASIWPLVAGCASAEQVERVVGHLQEPSEFWRNHLFPSTAADSWAYDPAGYYWRGGVWAPTTYAAVQALEDAGEADLAREVAENHLRNLRQVYEGFAPADGQLASDSGGKGDGIGTLWELYAPDAVSPGTR